LAPELVDVADVCGVNGHLTDGNTCDGLHGGRRRAHLLPLAHSGDKYLHRESLRPRSCMMSSKKMSLQRANHWLLLY